ncbi:MAG: creatininase family protein [Solirubrobacteraceae bacterium]
MATELAQLTSSDLERTGMVPLVPVGATEQHGPHLPLGTDTALAVALANADREHREALLEAATAMLVAQLGAGR